MPPSAISFCSKNTLYMVRVLHRVKCQRRLGLSLGLPFPLVNYFGNVSHDLGSTSELRYSSTLQESVQCD